MPAFLILLGTLFTWVALYQGILAYAVGPPPDGDLVTVSGRIDDVDTPWTRNRFVEATQMKIEVAPRTTAAERFVTVAVRQATLDTAALKLLAGKSVTVRFAGGRPRNRWVYDLVSDGQQFITLELERRRDRQAFDGALRLMLLNAALATVIMTGAWLVKRRRSSQAQDLANTP